MLMIHFRAPTRKTRTPASEYCFLDELFPSGKRFAGLGILIFAPLAARSFSPGQRSGKRGTPLAAHPPPPAQVACLIIARDFVHVKRDDREIFFDVSHLFFDVSHVYFERVTFYLT